MIRQLMDRFRQWMIVRQSDRFTKELKRKNYIPFKTWDNGVWK